MPQIQIPRSIIQVDLSDRHFNDTTIKQEAIFESLRHEQDHTTGVASTTINVIVKSYGNDNGAKGIYLGDRGMFDQRVPLVADNNTVVSPATGAILAIKDRMTTLQDWQATLDAIEEDWCFQGDFFIQLREAAPVVIGDMVRQHIAQADALGKFA